MRASHTVHVTDGQYFLLDGGGTAYPDPGPALDTAVDRILFPDVRGNGGVYLMPGTFDGPLDVTVESLDAPPAAALEDDGWEHTEELTATSAGSSLFVATLSARVEELPAFPVTPGGRFGVRLRARGVTAARGRPEPDGQEAPVESHLIQVWTQP